MKKAILFFAGLCMACGRSDAAPFEIKKASAVQEQQQGKMEAATGQNLISMAMGLYAGVKGLKQQQDALTEQCAPSGTDINFVNKMVQEYAKIGKQTSGEMWDALPAKELKDSCTYAEMANKGDGAEICYDYYSENDAANKGRIWAKYPIASKAKLCPPDKPDCAGKGEKHYSNIYEIYGEMGWSEEDLLPDEASTHAKLMQKAEECSPASVKKKKQDLTGNLIQQTMGSIGVKQGTGNVMSQVGSLMQSTGGGSSNLMGGLGAIGQGMLPSILGGGM